MACVVADRFKWYGRLCLLTGCLFVRGLHRNIKNATTSPKSWYSLYASFCIITLYVGEFTYIVTGSRSEFNESRLSTRVFYGFVYGFAQFKVAVNIATSVIKASELLNFFRAAERYERVTGFQRSRDSFAMSKVFLLVRITMVAIFCSAAAMTFSYLADRCNETPSLLLKVYLIIVVVLDLFLYLPHDIVYSSVLRPNCEVLVAYIRAQCEELVTVAQRTDPLSRMQNVSRLERIRVDLCAVRNLKVRLERIWKWPLLMASVNVLISMSIDISAAFEKAVTSEGIFLSAVFSTYQALDFADLSMLSQAMVNEATRLKGILKTMATGDCPECYINQVHFLYDAVQPNDMRLNCGNFFKLDTPLLVTMAGAIITFTVILVQTVDQSRL
ncbi:hypothetical protein V5799_011297 [Amblyomma americanum]|uniref:Gustatory receptor n=1 Tax=Amblyomma americanum TaxID=6943 RepID=A0AAQ4EIA9_AMBAM